MPPDARSLNLRRRQLNIVISLHLYHPLRRASWQLPPELKRTVLCDLVLLPRFSSLQAELRMLHEHPFCPWLHAMST